MAPNPNTIVPPSTFDIIDDETESLTMGAVKLSKRQWMTMAAIGSVHFSSAICISLQAPFYPAEAEKKNATATEYGFVFGSFELVAFITSPILGNYLDCIGVKPALNIGMLIAATSAILFGMLDFVKEHNWFISLSFLLRMTEALGSTAALVAAFSITAAVFPKSIGTTFATLEVFYGIGYIVGPSIGGFLFSIGGFKLPFVVNGLTMFITAIVIVYILPPIYTEAKDKDEEKDGIMDVLKVPAVLLNSVAVVATSISMGFYSATLEPHLRQFNLSPIWMGLMFVISGGTYACVAPIVGRLCDHWVYPKRVISVGCIFIITSYIIVGPAPFLPFPTTLPLCVLGLVIHGFGLASLMVPTFMDSICSAVAAGFEDDISTYGLLSGLWSASFSLGAFVGPSVAGFLLDTVGFRNGSMFVVTVHTILFVYTTCFITFEKQRSLPPNRVRLLSERVEADDTSDYEPFPTPTPKTDPGNGLLVPWELRSGRAANKNSPNNNQSYGSIKKAVEVL